MRIVDSFHCAQPAKATPFAGGNEADVRRNPIPRSRQKPRLLPAATKLMSAEIASCDFGQSN
jgi:hypothetical protein